VRYDVPYAKLHDEERKFLAKLGKKLKQWWYVWFIHLEYKFDSKNKKLWFIERWARLGWERIEWIKKLHYFDIPTLLYEIHSGDISKWKPYKGSYIFKNIIPNMHYVGLYQNFLEKTHVGTVLTAYDNYVNISYKDYMLSLISQYGVVPNDMKILLTHKKWYLHPSIEGRWTRCKIYIELNDEMFLKLKKKKIDLIEQLSFFRNPNIK
jgi:hypothetical protein